MPRRIHRALILAMVVLGLTSTSVVADQERFKIIVNPNNSSDSVSREFLRDVFLKKATEWHGNTVRPIDLSVKQGVRAEFTKDVIRKSPAQLRAYWAQQVFSGKGVPPPEVDSPARVVEYVLANPGAVGYLPADADTGKAKVVPLR